MKTTMHLIVLLLAGISQVGFAQPIQLHPENPHYFLYNGKPTILITSGEHYGSLMNLDFDYKTYFETLKKDNMNLTRVFSGAYCESPGSFNIEKNTLAPKANKLLAPWARSNVPGYKNGGNKFDLTKWNDAYFKRLQDFMAEADKNGVVVEFNLFCPFYGDAMWELSPMNAANNINGFSTVKRTEAYNLSDSKLQDAQDQLVRKIVSELKGFDNLYYEICNEPYFGGVTAEWQRHISQVIADAESGFAQKHLISQNIANGSKVIEHPDPNVSIFNFHYAYPPNAVEQNYRLNKVIGLNETGFKGSEDHTYRGQAWAFIMAGGALYNNLDYSFTAEQEDGTATQKAPGGGSPALRKQLKILQDFISGFDFIHMQPSKDAFASIEPKKVKGWALANEGQEYALYFRNGENVTVKLRIPTGIYRVEWINTVTGKVDKQETVESNNGTIRLESPVYRYGIGLSIRAK